MSDHNDNIPSSAGNTPVATKKVKPLRAEKVPREEKQPRVKEINPNQNTTGDIEAITMLKNKRELYSNNVRTAEDQMKTLHAQIKEWNLELKRIDAYMKASK